MTGEGAGRVLMQHFGLDADISKILSDWIMPAVLRKDAENDFIVRMVDIRELAGREVGRTIENAGRKKNCLNVL